MQKNFSMFLILALSIIALVSVDSMSTVEARRYGGRYRGYSSHGYGYRIGHSYGYRGYGYSRHGGGAGGAIAFMICACPCIICLMITVGIMHCCGCLPKGPHYNENNGIHSGSHHSETIVEHH